MNIYIGNFSNDVTEDDLREIFGAFGRVESAKIIKDKFTGESKGFGFIEMINKTEAESAMQQITEVKGKRVTINEARPQVRHGSGAGKKGGFRGKSFRSAQRY